jgi:hypothetical protein
MSLSYGDLLLSLVSTIEDPLGRISSGSGLEIRKYGLRDPSHWPRVTLYLKKIGTNFADKRRSPDRYSLLADSGHEVDLAHNGTLSDVYGITSIDILWPRVVAASTILIAGLWEATPIQ